MTTDNAAPPAGPDTDEYAWLRDGSVPHSREDRVAEVLALVALLFSLGIGLVIALLPVSAKAAEPAAASLGPSAFESVAHPRRARTIGNSGEPRRLSCRRAPPAGDRSRPA